MSKLIKRPVVDFDAVSNGDAKAFAIAVAACAARWLELAGSHVAFPLQASDVAREEGTAKAGLMAAAMDLRACLCQSPCGREALGDFGFEPVLQHIKGE